jgi:hypothetical protein
MVNFFRLFLLSASSVRVMRYLAIGLVLTSSLPLRVAIAETPIAPVQDPIAADPDPTQPTVTQTVTPPEPTANSQPAQRQTLQSQAAQPLALAEATVKSAPTSPAPTTPASATLATSAPTPAATPAATPTTHAPAPAIVHPSVALRPLHQPPLHSQSRTGSVQILAQATPVRPASPMPPTASLPPTSLPAVVNTAPLQVPMLPQGSPMAMPQALQGWPIPPTLPQAQMMMPQTVMLVPVSVPMGGPATPVPYGMPMTGMPMNGIPMVAMPMTGMPMTGMPMNGIPMVAMPMTGMPMTGMPMTGMPMNGMPMVAMPMTGMPIAPTQYPGQMSGLMLTSQAIQTLTQPVPPNPYGMQMPYQPYQMPAQVPMMANPYGMQMPYQMPTQVPMMGNPYGMPMMVPQMPYPMPTQMPMGYGMPMTAPMAMPTAPIYPGYPAVGAGTAYPMPYAMPIAPQMGQMPMGQMPMGQMPMGQFPIGQVMPQMVPQTVPTLPPFAGQVSPSGVVTTPPPMMNPLAQQVPPLGSPLQNPVDREGLLLEPGKAQQLQGSADRPLLKSTAVTEPKLTLQGVYLTQAGDNSARARLQALYPLTSRVLFGATFDLSTGRSFTDTPNDGFNVNELFFSTSLPEIPNLRFVVGQLDLTSYFDRNSFAKDGASHFFNPIFQTNPALAATGIGSRPGLLVNWALTDNIEAKAAAFSSSRGLGDFTFNGFAGEVGVRYGNAIFRGTYSTGRDGGSKSAFREVFAADRGNGRFGTLRDDREEAFGFNAEVFLPKPKLGLFARYGRYNNMDLGEVGDTYSVGLTFLDVFSPDDRLGLAYGQDLSNQKFRIRAGDKRPDALEVFYDFRFLPNLRMGFSVQQREDFSEIVAGFRVKTEFDVTPKGKTVRERSAQP